MRGTRARPDLQFGFCLFLSPSLKGRFWFCLGFPFHAGGVLCTGFLLGVLGGQALRRIGGLAEQLVKPGRLIVKLHLGRRGGPQFLFRLGRELG